MIVLQNFVDVFKFILIESGPRLKLFLTRDYPSQRANLEIYPINQGRAAFTRILRLKCQKKHSDLKNRLFNRDIF